jgi:predicted membrane protein DUF2232
MMQIVLVGLGAGVAAALLFASVASGSMLATLLFYLAPLPILIAALGWSHWAGLLAGLVAATSLGVALNLYFFAFFFVGIALPAWWLSYLALLARPVATNGSTTLEWYPIGRLVLWAALISAAIIIVAVLNLGADKETFQTALRSAFERALRIQGHLPVDAPDSLRSDIDRLIGIMVAVILPVAAVISTFLSVLNLWLAGRIVRVSGRLARPWPDLSALTLPAFAPALVAAAIAGSFLPDIAGILSGVVAASLFAAYAILGFAVLHTITHGLPNRAFALTCTYVAVVVFGLLLFGSSILAMSLLGLADAAFNIRARAALKRGPPDIHT